MRGATRLQALFFFSPPVFRILRRHKNKMFINILCVHDTFWFSDYAEEKEGATPDVGKQCNLR